LVTCGKMGLGKCQFLSSYSSQTDTVAADDMVLVDYITV
jgi:hypothetical protein